MAAAARSARTCQRIYGLVSSAQVQQPQRQLSVFGDFFKKVKSEASSNQELQKAVQELKKTGDSVRERAKAASKVVEQAASASSEAAKAAAQQAQRQASEVSAAVRERLAQTPAAGAQNEHKHPSAAPESRVGTSSQASAKPTGDAALAEPPDPNQTAGQQSGAPEAGTSAGPHHRASSAADGGAGQGPGTAGHADTGAKASAGTSGAAGESASETRQRVAAAGLLERIRNAADIVRKEVVAAVLPNDSIGSATRAVDVKPRNEKDATTGSAIMAAPVSRFQRQWQDLHEKLQDHPIFQRLASLRDSRVFTRGREMASDVRERWETSDSAMVQRIQDMTDSMFTESEMALALREIRARDPRFDMVLFLQRLKKDVPVVIKGSLEGDAPLLRQHCAPEMVERFTGLFSAMKAQGKFSDSTILDWSDVELVDMKFLESQPVVVVQFTVQQLNCWRDAHGNVVEGDPNSVQRVYYYWALQQDAAGFVGVDGQAYPPRWQLREQVMRAMHNLL